MMLNNLAGAWFKLQGDDGITQETVIDVNNYIVPPATGNTSPNFKYDFPVNYVPVKGNPNINGFFGGQWLNFNLMFPQYGYAFDGATNRHYEMADVFFAAYDSRNGGLFFTNNKQKLFAGITNSANFLRGDSFQTTFVNVPRAELSKLINIPYKGINVELWNIGGYNSSIPAYSAYTESIGTLSLPPLDVSPYMYLPPNGITTNGQQYQANG